MGSMTLMRNKDMFLFNKFISCLAVLIVGGCIASSSAYIHENDVVEDVSPEIEKRALPALKWDGVCPKKIGTCPSSFRGKTPLIIISLDGFRPDYFERGFTSTLNRIAQCGANARFMYPVFPTKTYPNHYSQVTGLYPSSHGIIDNSMYDTASGKVFKVGRNVSLEPFWWEKEPIWVTARKQGKIAACFFWPGSDVVINGTMPNMYKNYQSRITFEDRVDQVLAWLDLNQASRPDFITLYANQPDNAAHHYGINSKQVNDALAKVDRMISRLFSGLQQRNLVDCVNVVITSDHGMSDIDCKRIVDLQNYIDTRNVFITAGPFGRVRPKGRRNTTLVNQLVSKMKCKSPHMRVYPKEQLPVRMHYAEHYRIEPIFLDMDGGWTVISKDLVGKDEICTGGAHGYDNLIPDMRSIFIAHGPSFKKNYTSRPFISTELYEMYAELLNIRPNPNNGTKGSLHHIMASPRALREQIEQDPPAVGTVPEDETEYKFRIYASNCSCSQTQTKRQVQEKDLDAIGNLHLPFGIPYSPEDNSTLRLLYNKDYVTAFDLKYRIPMWTSFTLKERINITKLDEVCWRGDARIPIYDAANCGDYKNPRVTKNFILQRPLYSPGFSNNHEASYITNSIPKSLNHTKLLEKPMNQILAKWTSQSKELNVVTGPAFDLAATGIRPPIGRLMRLHEKTGPIVAPTHIFVIATWCKAKKSSLKDCSPSKLEAHAFLLPNQPFVNNCESSEKVISQNVARVVDVEKLTGISFYTRLPIYEAIRLRTIMPERSL